MSLQDQIEKFLYGQVMWSGQVADPKREAATIAAMLLDLLREGQWFDEAAIRLARCLVQMYGVIEMGDAVTALRAALGEDRDGS